MALLPAGYWQPGFYPSGMWQTTYWPKYGFAAVSVEDLSGLFGEVVAAFEATDFSGLFDQIASAFEEATT
jgi:hypothetical protein